MTRVLRFLIYFLVACGFGIATGWYLSDTDHTRPAVLGLNCIVFTGLTLWEIAKELR